MYIGARKITAINTLFNVLFFFILMEIMNKEIKIYELFVAIVIMGAYYLFNIYNLEKGKYRVDDLMYSMVVNVIFLIVNIKFYFFDNFFKIIILNLVFQNLSKVLFYYFCVKNKKILIIGNSKENEELKNIIDEKDYYTLAGELTLKQYDDIEEIVQKKNISKIIITEDTDDVKFAVKILNQKLKGIQVFDYLSFYEKLEEKVPVKSINEKWILFGSGYDILYKSFNIRVKRIFDIVFALFIGIVTLPIMFISAIVVKLESKGPLLFKQQRIGLGNVPFTVYKFRSMKIHDEKEHSRYAQDNDDRITKFGNFMRKTRIDELPQLWNVLIGDMSFVGPRCEWDKLCKEYEKELPFYNIRHSVKPGLTGWAQVRYPYGMGVEDALHKLTYDIYYIKHQNLAFDIMILFKTVKIVVFGRGR